MNERHTWLVDTVLSVVEGGNYTVVIMAPNGCSSAASDAITVVVEAQPEVPAILSRSRPRSASVVVPPCWRLQMLGLRVVP